MRGSHRTSGPRETGRLHALTSDRICDDWRRSLHDVCRLRLRLDRFRRLGDRYRLLQIRGDDLRQHAVGGRNARRIRPEYIGERGRHRLDGRQHLARDGCEYRSRHRIERHRQHHAALCLIEGSKGADRARHRSVTAVPLVRRINDRGRRHDARLDAGDSSFREAQFLSRRARNVELTLAPIWSGVVDAHDRRVAVVAIANEQDRTVGVDGARRAVGFLRAEGFAGRRQSARVQAVAAAIVVIRGFEDLVASDDGDHFRNTQHSVADAIEAVRLPGGFCFYRRGADCG